MTTTEMTPQAVDSPAGKKQKVWRRDKVSVWTYISLGLLVFVSIFPFYWMYVVSSNGSEAISKIPPELLPGSGFIDRVKQIQELIPFQRALLNTLGLATFISVINVFFSALAGFALAKLRMPGKKSMLTFIVGTMMLPAQLGIIFLYGLMTVFGWVNDFKSIIIPAIVGAFGVFWMRQVIDSQIPNELLEAARIDGASVFRIYMKIVVPAILPSAFVLGLFSFLYQWNDYLWPWLMLQEADKFTVQVAITSLNTSYVQDYALNMCAALLGTAPLLVLFIFVGRRLVSGVMDGAVKG